MHPFDPAFTPPLRWHTARYELFPTTVDRAESDYAAVMASQGDLRRWSDSTWPEDDFTVEANRADLQHHVDDNRDHSAYGYMIYRPAEDFCLGSLYVNPVNRWPQYYDLASGDAAAIARFQVRLDYWIRTGYPEVERDFTAALPDWIQSAWGLRPVWPARTTMTDRIAIYRQLGFQRLAELRNRETGTMLELWAPQPEGSSQS